MQERQGVSFRRLSWLAALLAAVAAAGAYVAYVELLHYRRSAAEHLPASTVFAARVDVEQVLLFEPVRRHLLPLVEALPPAPAQRDRAEHETRLARLRAAGLNLGLDLREIVVATTAERGWLVALGGLFPKAGMIEIVGQMLHDEDARGWARQGNRLELSPSGMALAQAADGTLILASDGATLAAALAPSTRYLELALAREGAGGAALLPREVTSWSYPGPSGWLQEARALVARLRLGRELELEVQVEVADPARAQQLADQARRWAPGGDGHSESLPAGVEDPAGFWARTRFVEAAETHVKLQSSWRSAELDRNARELAAWIRRQLSAAGRAGS
jgi:hypothetical protein